MKNIKPVFINYEYNNVSFAKHETFPPRWRWFKKGVDAASQDFNIFSRENAHMLLGVGKNMARAIKYWCLAAKILSPIWTYGNKGSVVVTDLGERLLGKNGWDPYLSDPASLWLLHWLITSNEERATTWNIAFTNFYGASLTQESLVRWISKKLEGWSVNIARSTINKDVSCFFRSYVLTGKGNRSSIEDEMESAFVELGIILPVEGESAYRFVTGFKPSLPAEILGYALVDYIDKHAGSGTVSVSVDDCLYGVGSPGQAFKLDDDSFTQMAYDLAKISDDRLGLSSSAGVRYFYRRGNINPEDLLNMYYGER